MKTTLQTSKMATDPGQVLSFNNLTYVDVYLYQGDTLIAHQQTGAFRARNYIGESDGRLFATPPARTGKDLYASPAGAPYKTLPTRF
ncbi:hypothetical protein ACQ86N_25005 [Puia sp. P3]|uniref:hypothetical protein n=1 Tax=Puia sp. P3 TaxID=3423952 RepID=UPI003D667482